MTAYCDYCGLPEKDCICVEGDEGTEINAFCPHCMAIWGFDEMEWERCYSCGYPYNEDYDSMGAEDDYTDADDRPIPGAYDPLDF